MKTNEIKKGMRIKLKNGWYGTMMDNKRGNIRMAEIEGTYKEMGSIYASDIFAAKGENGWENVELTSAQEKSMALNKALFG